METDNFGIWFFFWTCMHNSGLVEKAFRLPTYLSFQHGYREDDDHEHEYFHGHSSYTSHFLWYIRNPRKSHKIFIEILSKSQSFVEYGVLERTRLAKKMLMPPLPFSNFPFLPSHKQYFISKKRVKELCWSQVWTGDGVGRSTLKFKTCGLSLAFLVFNKPKIISGRVVMVVVAVCASFSLCLFHFKPTGKNTSFCLELDEERKSMSEFSHECTSLQPSFLVSTKNYRAC